MSHTTYDLKIEYLSNPLGIDVLKPHFGWKMASDVANAIQSAYQIIVSCCGEVVWDSGQVTSPQSIQIEYGGPALKARTRYDVAVQTWDGDGEACEPITGWFETGLFRSKWAGSWIRGNEQVSPNSPWVGKKENPVYYFRKKFKLNALPVRARLYATSLGFFEAHCNGDFVSDEVFAPGWTDYFSRVQYRTYDVTSMMRAGDNALGFKLAAGWYCGRIAKLWNNEETTYGITPKLRAMLICDFEDGHSQTIATDTDWRWTCGGPELFSDIYDGECYDARLEMDDFATPEFSDRGWCAPFAAAAGIKMVGAAYLPVRRCEKLKPVNVTYRHNGDYIIIDFGQNCAGRERITCTLPEGELMIVRHGEMLTQEGALYTENLRSALATSWYCGDGTTRTFEPSFTFYGYRYLEINGAPKDFDPWSVRSIVLHTDMERTGDFSCSNHLLNRLFSNILWGQRSNYVDVPTDCPQRDERLGWTGDAQAFIRMGSYNYHVGAFFAKYLQDLEACRNEYGEYPSIAPDPYMRITPSTCGQAAWEDAAFICPAEIYRKYGDKTLLERHFEAMANGVRTRLENSRNFIWAQSCYGDWLNIGAPLPPEQTGTAFFAYSAHLVSKFAAIIGRKEEEAEFENLYQNIKKAYCENFLDEEGRLKLTWEGTERSWDAGDSKGVPLSCRTQTGALMSLKFDLLPAESIPKVMEDLVEDIKKHDNHLTTGFIGTSYLVSELARNGRADIAYALFEQRSYPSWLYSVDQGATTIWERWNSFSTTEGFGRICMNSFNHYAYGAAGDFMYEYIAGIKPLAPGFRKFSVRPCPGGTLTSARGEYVSEYGKIVSDWKIEDEVFTLSVTVPANTLCRVILPDGTTYETGSGTYDYSCAMP